jgi:hypothetical protein
MSLDTLSRDDTIAMSAASESKAMGGLVIFEGGSMQSSGAEV